MRSYVVQPVDPGLACKDRLELTYISTAFVNIVHTTVVGYISI